MKSTGVRVLADDAQRLGYPTCPEVVRSGYRAGEVCGFIATHDGGTRCPYHSTAARSAASRKAKGGGRKRAEIRKRVRRALLAQVAARLGARRAVSSGARSGAKP